MDNRRNQQPYTYADAGFSPFLSRSIGGRSGFTLRDTANGVRQSNTQQLNLDQYRVSGSLGDVFQIGSGDNRIELNGPEVKIAGFQDNNEVVRIGELDS